MADRRRRKVRFMGRDFVRDEEALGEWYRCDCYELTTDYGECGDGKFRWSWSLCFGAQGRIDGPSRTTRSAAKGALENEVSKCGCCSAGSSMTGASSSTRRRTDA